MNTPWIFSNTILKDLPLGRQLMSFPLRSATMATQTGYLGRTENPYLQGLVDLTRLMGTSAVIYEGWKGLTGGDLSRGLGYSAITDILPFFEGGRYSEREGPIPTPPIADISINLAQGLLGGDPNLFLGEIPKLFPGGIALQRFLGTAAPVDILRNSFQKTYVGWDQPLPDGRVPVYKSDGTLIEYQSPRALWLRGVGLDAGATRDNTRLSRAIRGATEEARSYKQQYMQRALNNDTDGAQVVAAEFQRRFQVPLKISEAQMRAALKSRRVPVAERLTDRTPTEIRPQVNQWLASQSPLFNTRPEAFAQFQSSGARPREGDTQASMPGFSGFQGY
jgi:hypothetical protein